MKRVIILALILVSMMPAVAVAKQHSFTDYIISLVTPGREIEPAAAVSHLKEEDHSEHNDLDSEDFDAGNFRAKCSEKSLEEQVQCFVDFFGSTLTNKKVEKFSELAESSFNKLWIDQKFIYRFMPEDKLDEKLPEYFKIYSGDVRDLADRVKDEVKACDHGFVFHWFKSESADKITEDEFRHHGQFFGSDCSKKDSVKVILFNGIRRGYYKEKPASMKSRDFIKTFARDSMLYIVNRHFGLSS